MTPAPLARAHSVFLFKSQAAQEVLDSDNRKIRPQNVSDFFTVISFYLSQEPQAVKRRGGDFKAYVNQFPKSCN